MIHEEGQLYMKKLLCKIQITLEKNGVEKTHKNC